MGQTDLEFRLRLPRLRRADVPERQRPGAVLYPHLPVDLVALEGQVGRRDAIDRFTTDDPATFHLLGEDVIRVAEQEVGSGRVYLELLAGSTDGRVERRRRGAVP